MVMGRNTTTGLVPVPKNPPKKRKKSTTNSRRCHISPSPATTPAQNRSGNSNSRPKTPKPSPVEHQFHDPNHKLWCGTSSRPSAVSRPMTREDTTCPRWSSFNNHLIPAILTPPVVPLDPHPQDAGLAWRHMHDQNPCTG